MINENISEKNSKSDSPRFVRDVVRPFRVAWARLKPRTTFLYWLLTLFFFLLPLQARWIVRAPLDHGVPYEWGTLSIYGIEILGLLVILFAVPFLKKFPIPNSQFPILLLPILAFFSIFWAADKLVALQGVVVLLEGVLLYTVLSHKLQAPNYKEISNPKLQITKPGFKFEFCNLFGIWDLGFGISAAFVAGAVIQAAVGIYQFLTQSSFASKWLGMALHDPRELGTSVVEFTDERWLRAYGGLPHPNVLGGLLVMALAMTVVMWQRSQMSQILQEDAKILSDNTTCGRMRFCQLASKVVFPILLTGIFFSFSRAAWVAAVGLLGYWGIGLLKIPSPQPSPTRGEGENKKSPPLPAKGGSASGGVGGVRGGGERQTARSGRFYFLFIALYIFFLIFTFRPLVFTRVASQSRLEVKSRVERVEGLREAWTLIKKHPVLGVGMGNYTQAVAHEVRPGQPLFSYQPVHNVFLLVWAELGTVGIFLFVATLCFIVRRSTFYIFNFTFLILLMSDHFLWSLPFGVLMFWGVMGLSAQASARGGFAKKACGYKGFFFVDN